MRKLLTFLIALGAIVFAVGSPAHADCVAVPGLPQSGTGCAFYYPPSSGGGGASLIYTVTDVSQAWDNTTGGSWASVNIGTVAPDRIIVVTLAVESNSGSSCDPDNGTGPTGVTVGGHQMINATGTLAASSGGECLFVYYLLAPSSVLNASSAAIVVNAPYGQAAAISVGNMNGSATASVNAANGSSWGQAGGASPRCVPNDLSAVAVASGGVVVTGALIDRNTSLSWVNATLDLNNQDAAGPTWTFGQAHGASGSPGATGATNFNANCVIASFKP